MSDSGIHADRTAAFAPGIFPRSAELVQATRDLDRGRVSAEVVAELAGRERQALLEAQRAAGLDPLVDSMLEWQDLFRPLAERCRGVEARPLVRFLETNTFFRGLVVSEPPQLREPMPAPALPAGWAGVLPSPLALAHASSGAVRARDWAARVLSPQLDSWAAAGAGLVVLDEPFLAREPSGFEELAEGLGALSQSCPLLLRLPFADAGPLLDRLFELPVTGIGIDFWATRLDALPRPFPLLLYAGVIDVRSSAVDDVTRIVQFAAALADVEPSGLALGTNGDLQFVPEPIARAKLDRLGQARRLLSEAT